LTPSPSLSPRTQRRNFTLGVANGTLIRLFDTLAHPTLVLTWFVVQLGASPLIIGLLIPIANGGWFLPQLLMSATVHRLPRKIWLYRVASVVRVVLWAAIVALVFLLGSGYPRILLVLFLLLYSAFSFGAGVSGLPWLEVIAKAVPARRRGPFFAWRDFTGGLLAIGGSLLVGYLLDERYGPGFPYNFGWLLLLAGLAAALAYLLFGLIVEPIEEAIPAAPSSNSLRAAWSVVRRDRNFGLLVLVRVFALSSSICAPFYTLFAQQRLGAPVAMAGTYVGAFTLALVGSTLLWGRVSERFGNRVVVWCCGLLAIPAPLLTVLLGTRLSYAAFTAVFALLGVVQTGTDIGFLSLGLDLAPAAERPLYLGLLNTVLGIVSFALVVGGWIVTRWGLEAVFGISLGSAVLWLVLVGALREPKGISPA
jgi:MFS family permease